MNREQGLSYSKPYISIVIPTYNRANLLLSCLQSLTDLDYPKHRFEVIIVDDGSSVSLKESIQLFQKVINLTLIKQANAGPAAARNTGAKAARGRILAFTDDDCQPASNWLSILEKYFCSNSLSPYIFRAVGGQVCNSLQDNFCSTASQLIVDYLYSHYNSDHSCCKFFTSNNFAISAIAFRSLGGFDQTFPLAAGEDREFCARCYSQGYQLVYAPDAVVYHGHRLTLSSFWKQQSNYGKGAYQFYKHQAKDSPVIYRNNLTFYLQLIFYPLTRYSIFKASIITLLVILSQVAVVVGFLAERNK